MSEQASNYGSAAHSDADKTGDSKVDTIAALATVIIFVTTVLFWISNQ